MTYDPGIYWKEAGKSYYQNFQWNDDFVLQEQVLIQYLAQLDFNSVLEVGCGFGRITKLLLKLKKRKIKEYVAIDLSWDQLDEAQRYAGKKPIYVISDIQNLMIDRKFDLVIAVEVLMHQPPDQIEGVIFRMVNLSNKHIIHLDWYVPGYINNNAFGFCYSYDYEAIYERLGYSVKELPIPYPSGIKQSIFHATK